MLILDRRFPKFLTFKHRPVLEEASEPEGHQLEDRLQDKDQGENVVADLQRLIQLLVKREDMKD